jgi:hypothetical protein
VIRTKRLRVPADLFERDAVVFKRARVEAGGTIQADGHNIDLYGMELIRREGARWACGQRAFMAMRHGSKRACRTRVGGDLVKRLFFRVRCACATPQGTSERLLSDPVS